LSNDDFAPMFTYRAPNTMVNPASNDEAIDNPLKDEGPVKVLLRLTESARFLRSADGCFYAHVTVGGRPEV